MRFIFLSGLVLGLASTHSFAQQDGEWRGAVADMRHFCMAEVCLGMTVEEIALLPRGQLQIWDMADWSRNCSGTYARWNHAYFTSKAGTKFTVGFRDYPGAAEPKKRFRVQSIALYLEVGRSELNELRQKLTTRHGMVPATDSVAPVEEWKLTSPLFDAVISSSFSDAPKKSLLMLSAKSERYPGWLQSQPACQKDRKPLPNL